MNDIANWQQKFQEAQPEDQARPPSVAYYSERKPQEPEFETMLPIRKDDERHFGMDASKATPAFQLKSQMTDNQKMHGAISNLEDFYMNGSSA